ncbi:MAG: hypothetical protein ABIJ21_00820 [Nanoarchaeota archaeon]
MRKRFIFDLDGTLIPCERYYQQRINMFWAFMEIELGHDVPTVATVAHMVERENWRLIEEQGGFYDGIFAQSLVNTYVLLAEGLGMTPKKNVKEKLHLLGKSVFDSENYHDTVFQGVFEILDFLLGKGDELVLYTKGSPIVQQMKLDVNGLTKYFPHPVITPMKDRNGFSELVGDFDKSCVYKVGNSTRSDVIPATQIGIRVIHIPREEWSYENNHNGIEHPELVVRLKNVLDIMKIYPRLDTEWDSLTLAKKDSP